MGTHASIAATANRLDLGSNILTWISTLWFRIDVNQHLRYVCIAALCVCMRTLHIEMMQFDLRVRRQQRARVVRTQRSPLNCSKSIICIWEIGCSRMTGRMCQDVIVNIFGRLACVAIEKRFSIRVERLKISRALCSASCNVHILLCMGQCSCVSMDFYGTSITTGN